MLLLFAMVFAWFLLLVCPRLLLVHLIWVLAGFVAGLSWICICFVLVHFGYVSGLSRGLPSVADLHLAGLF